MMLAGKIAVKSALILTGALTAAAPVQPTQPVKPDTTLKSLILKPRLPYSVTTIPRTITPNMTSIPKSYEIYLLYRSDGVLIGPKGIVPLKPQRPQGALVAPPVTAPQK